MGTAIVGVAASLNPGHVASLTATARTFSQVTTIVILALAVVILVPYLGPLFLHPDAAVDDLRNPAVGALYGTLPGGILVVSAAMAAVGSTWFAPSTVRDIVSVLDWVGISLALVISSVFVYLLFLNAQMAPGIVNGSWFIPRVVNIVVPRVLVPLVPGSSPTTARTLLFLSYGFWGMGLLLYLLIIAMLFQRLVLHPLAHVALALNRPEFHRDSGRFTKSWCSKPDTTGSLSLQSNWADPSGLPCLPSDCYASGTPRMQAVTRSSSGAAAGRSVKRPAISSYVGDSHWSRAVMSSRRR
jgi:hypothetical protein